MDDQATGSDAGQLAFLSRDELEERVRQRSSELENVMSAMADVLGYDPADREGKPVDVLFTEPPDDSQSPVSSVTQLLERLLAERRVTDVAVYCSTADGDTVPMSLSASMLEDEDGLPTGIVCVAKDRPLVVVFSHRPGTLPEDAPVHPGGDPGETARDHWRTAAETFEEIGAPGDTLRTLETLVESCRERCDDEGLRESVRRARAVRADAPDPAGDQHGDWVATPDES